MPVTSPVVWYKSKIVFGSSSVYPVYPGAALSANENIAVEQPIGSVAGTHYGLGLIQPMLELQMAVTDHATESVLALAFLNQFMSRTADVAHDTTAVSNGVSFWDGYAGWAAAGVKCDSFTIAGSKGAGVTFTVRLVASGLSAITSDPYSAWGGWAAYTLLRFPSVNFSGALAGKVWSFQLSFSNNHWPDMALDGTQMPAAWHASAPTASLRIRTMAKDDVNVPGAGTVPDGTAIAFTITGGAITRTFTINKPINQTVKNRVVSPPAIMRDWAFDCLGASATGMPLTIT